MSCNHLSNWEASLGDKCGICYEGDEEFKWDAAENIYVPKMPDRETMLKLVMKEGEAMGDEMQDLVDKVQEIKDALAEGVICVEEHIEPWIKLAEGGKLPSHILILKDWVSRAKPIVFDDPVATLSPVPKL